MNRFRWGVIFILVILLSSGLYHLIDENSDLKQKIKELEVKFNAIQEENRNLTSQIEYYRYPENLVKELKARFNYREVSEKLMIVVPGQPTSSSTTLP